MHKIFVVFTLATIAACIVVAATIADKETALVLAINALLLVAMTIKMLSTHDAPMPHTSYHWLLAKIRSWPDEYWQRIGIDKELFEQWMTLLETAAWRQGRIVSVDGSPLPESDYLDKDFGGLGLAALGVVCSLYDAGKNPSSNRAKELRELFLKVCPGYGEDSNEPYPRANNLTERTSGDDSFDSAISKQVERFRL